MIDDILQRLAPSLKRHVGCTIIDINPGPGLWSSKLHEHLKPRSHILVEPRKDIYLPYLKPLLDTPNSRYHLRDWDDSVHWQPNRYVTDGLLPGLETSRSSQHRPTGRNDSLLIVANISALESRRPQDRDFESHKALKDFMADVRDGTGFHINGPVRLLMWLKDKEKHPILPRNIAQRKGIALTSEMTCHVEEIVSGVDLREKAQKREDILNVKSGKRVAERMRRQNILIPTERQGEMQRHFQDILCTAAGDDEVALNELEGAELHTSRKWHDELRQLKADFESGKRPRFIGCPPSMKLRGKRTNGPYYHTPEWLRFVQLKRFFKSHKLRMTRLGSLILEQEKLDSLEIGAYREGLSETKRQEIFEQLDRRTREVKAQVISLPVHHLTEYKYAIDNRRAFAQDPPLLMWDHRTVEPLLSQKEEFSNPKEMALFDVQPRFPNHYPMTSAQTAYFHLLINVLFRHNSRNLTILKQLAPGAMEALVPRVPALQDPRKGGRRDLDELRCRLITPEMAYGLALALDSWAFKPTLAVSLMKGHHASFRPGVE